ncbi:MAG: glycosyltransferase [Lachnospiraceae bacterium]|nr:glycosyltransferase [Lachnospiraceae bacterium]
MGNIGRTISYLKRNGVKPTFYAVWERLDQKRKYKYSYEPPSEEELEKQRNKKFKNDIKFSVVVPAYETLDVYMQDAILSVMEQTYQNVELVIADASESDVVEKVVKDFSEQYKNIVYIRLEKNGGISENTNAGIEIASGDYIGLLDHDDVLTPDALYHVAREIERCAPAKPYLIYSDEDKTDTGMERYYEPNIKCDLDEEMLHTNNYICHFSVFRADIIKELGLRAEFDGAQDFDLVLRTVKRAKEDDAFIETIKGQNALIRHIPHVLYHWRCHEASTADNPESKMYAYEAGRRAVEDATGLTVSHTKHVGFYHVDYGNDIFEIRKDIAALGGPVIRNNKVVGGLMRADGTVVFGGLHSEFAGVLNSATLQRCADVLDIRNIQVRKEYRDLFKKATGIEYEKRGEVTLDDEKAVKLSMEFCNRLRRQGVILLYDPAFGRKKYAGTD